MRGNFATRLPSPVVIDNSEADFGIGIISIGIVIIRIGIGIIGISIGISIYFIACEYFHI